MAEEPKTYNENNAARKLGNSNNFGTTKYYFRYFKSITEFQELAEEAIKEIKENNPKISQMASKAWRQRYINPGRPSMNFEGSTSKEILDKGPYFEKYIDEKALNGAIDAFDETLSEIDMGGAFKKSKLVTTEKSTGIFDFGLASPGLYPLQEFFSAKLKKDHPFEFPTELPGIVPPLYVDQNQMDQFWYVSKSNEKYQMTKQQKGTEGLEIKIPGAYLEFATSVKKVYVTFKREGGKANFVDLYVPVGGLRQIKSSGMLARALPVMMAARYFEQMGIRTRINATRAYTFGANKMVCFAWTIKDYGSDLDFKRIAIDTADTRFFRWNLWNWTSAILAKEFKVSQLGAYATVYDGATLRALKGRWRNWYFEEMAKNNVPQVNIKPELMLFGGLDNPPNTYVYSGPKDYVYKRIVKEFFKILDTVDFGFNKPSTAVQRIYDRIVMKEKESSSEFLRYVSLVLSEAFSYPIEGQYATPKDLQLELRDRFIEKSNEFSKYISQLDL